MRKFKSLTVFLAIIITHVNVHSQGVQAKVIDSIKAELAKANKLEEKMYWLDNLSRTLMNFDLKEAEKYGNEMIRIAEESRDRSMMIESYMSNGFRCSYLAAQREYGDKSVMFYNRALELARDNKIDEETGAAQLRLSDVYLSLSENEKALYMANQAFSLLSTLSNDSLKAEANNLYGRVYTIRNEKILALRHYLNALRIAEELKNTILIRTCYLNLSGFYKKIEQFDKAIDYYIMAYEKLDKIDNKNIPYQRVIDINAIGNLFADNKRYDIAISYFKRSISMADSLSFTSLKIPGYISLLNQYMRNDQPREALDYLNSPPGKQLLLIM